MVFKGYPLKIAAINIWLAIKKLLGRFFFVIPYTLIILKQALVLVPYHEKNKSYFVMRHFSVKTLEHKLSVSI